MPTGPATWDYRDRFHESFGRTYFRRYADGVVSSVGLGTYLGEPTDAVDEGYRAAVIEAVENGCNVIDTAINYRCQRSERAVGAALAEADVDREAVLVATKGGFVPFDGERPADPGRYVREEYVDPGIVDPEALVDGSHCVHPDFLDDQLDRSLANLDTDCVDLYYVHNPEVQLREHSREAVYDKLEAAFTRLEERAAGGDLQHYGLATWEAFRVPEDHDSYLSLAEVTRRARAASEAAGTEGTHFGAIQLPFNVEMADAFTTRAQDAQHGSVSALHFAREAGLSVFTSASIGQGDLTAGLPDEVASKLAGDSTVQRAINFARSAPGVTSALVGASDPAHVAENVAAGTFDPMGADAFDAVFE